MNTTISRRNRRALCIAALVLLIVFAWTRGTFDNFLWKVGLNYNECGQNAFGAVYCGDDMKSYEKKFKVNP